MIEKGWCEKFLFWKMLLLPVFSEVKEPKLGHGNFGNRPRRAYLTCPARNVLCCGSFNAVYPCDARYIKCSYMFHVSSTDIPHPRLSCPMPLSP